MTLEDNQFQIDPLLKWYKDTKLDNKPQRIYFLPTGDCKTFDQVKIPISQILGVYFKELGYILKIEVLEAILTEYNKWNIGPYKKMPAMPANYPQEVYEQIPEFETKHDSPITKLYVAVIIAIRNKRVIEH